MKNFIFIILFFLASCTRIEDVKKLPSTGNKFQQYLAKYYLKFAEAEAKQYDWIDSNYFLKKAMFATYGKSTPPENPNNWKISKNAKIELVKVYTQLNSLINKENIDNNPEELARLQFFYDSWIEEQEENWQFDQIEEYRENYYIALNDLNTAKEKKIKAKEVKKKTKPKTDPKKKKRSKRKAGLSKKKTSKNLEKIFVRNIKLQPEDYNILFNKNILTKEGQKSLRVLIPYIKSHNKTQVILNSYSKGKLSEEESLKISKSRALFIKKELIRAKIPENRIVFMAFGNSEILPLDNSSPNKLELYIGE